MLAAWPEAGHDPVVAECLKAPPSWPDLKSLPRGMGAGPRHVLRRKGTPYDALGLDDPSLSDEALIEAMLRHPILTERPIVVTARGVALCRPPETVQACWADPPAVPPGAAPLTPAPVRVAFSPKLIGPRARRQ